MWGPIRSEARRIPPKPRTAARFPPSQMALRNRHGQIHKVTLIRNESPAVEIVKHDHSEDCGPLVPIDERVVVHERMEERRRFGVNVGVGILPPDGLLWPKNGRLQESDVGEHAGANFGLVHATDVVDRQVVSQDLRLLLRGPLACPA